MKLRPSLLSSQVRRAAIEEWLSAHDTSPKTAPGSSTSTSCPTSRSARPSTSTGRAARADAPPAADAAAARSAARDRYHTPGRRTYDRAFRASKRAAAPLPPEAFHGRPRRARPSDTAPHVAISPPAREISLADAARGLGARALVGAVLAERGRRLLELPR